MVILRPDGLTTDSSETPRRPGRPPAAEPHVAVTAWIPRERYNELAHTALTEGQSISRLVKALLMAGRGIFL